MLKGLMKLIYSLHSGCSKVPTFQPPRKMMKIIGLSILSRWGGQGEGERVPTREVRPFSGNWSDFSNRS